MLRALIFDVDGTLADTETAHRHAFNAAFRQSGMDWHWDEALYAQLLQVAGGKERIAHYWRQADPQAARSRDAQQAIDHIHATKTQEYKRRVSGGQLKLRPGIERLIRQAFALGLPMAIATTTTPANVDALLSTPLGAGWRDYFAVVCDADTPGPKKPAPHVYLSALAALKMSPGDCLAFEDSENGLKAATAAGIPALITPTAYTANQDFNAALLVLPHLGDPGLPIPTRPGIAQTPVDVAALKRWHEGILSEAL